VRVQRGQPRSWCDCVHVSVRPSTVSQIQELEGTKLWNYHLEQASGQGERGLSVGITVQVKEPGDVDFADVPPLRWYRTSATVGQ